jgi:hypothetical protein
VYNVSKITSPCLEWTGFIYLAKYKKYNKWIYFILFLLFASYPIIYCNARSYTVVLTVSLAIFYIKELRISAKANIAILFILVVGMFVSMIGISSSIRFFVFQKMNLFEDSLSVLQGNKVEDSSANARLVENELAIGYIKENYILGSGVLKPSTQKEYIDEHFYPTDIGIIGVIFNYGVLGLVILLYQLRIFRNAFIEPITRNSTLVLGTAYYLLFQYIYSIFTGGFIYNIGLCFLLLGVLAYGRRSIEENVKIKGDLI